MVLLELSLILRPVPPEPLGPSRPRGLGSFKLTCTTKSSTATHIVGIATARCLLARSDGPFRVSAESLGSDATSQLRSASSDSVGAEFVPARITADMVALSCMSKKRGPIRHHCFHSYSDPSNNSSTVRRTRTQDSSHDLGGGPSSRR